MFGEADVTIWCKLLAQAAREKDPEKLAGILALIETAARVERSDLQRRTRPTRERQRHLQPPAPEVERHPWSSLLTQEDDLIQMGSNPTRNSELYLRYLRLADSALTAERPSSAEAKNKRKAA
jgi:hypothetical protein